MHSDFFMECAGVNITVDEEVTPIVVNDLDVENRIFGRS